MTACENAASSSALRGHWTAPQSGQYYGPKTGKDVAVIERRPTYNKQDILKEAGITPKQLRLWTEHGLFTPELGSRPGRETRFTEKDLRHVSVVKKLVVDEQYTTSTVKKMLDAGVMSNMIVTKGSGLIDLTRHYWDYNEQHWMTGDEIARRYVSSARSAVHLKEMVKHVWVGWLMKMKEESHSPTGFRGDIAEMQDLLTNASEDVLNHAGPTFDCMRIVWNMRSELALAGRADGADYWKKLMRKYRDHPLALWAVYECQNCLDGITIEEVASVELGWPQLCQDCLVEPDKEEAAAHTAKLAKEEGAPAMPTEEKG